MEITKENKYLKEIGVEQIDMGIADGDVAHIMKLLRKQTYSNPIKSLVREIMSNATDAHKRCGKKETPIKVEVLESPYRFVVTDYGESMDKEKVKNVYANLGSSDKRSSNEAIGGFGIGSASPLAYTNKFFIETFTLEEDKYYYRKYCQYIDESERGRIGVLKDEASYEEITGTRITVPIEKDDYYVVQQYALYYCEYLDTIPQHNIDESLRAKTWHSIYQANGWKFKKRERSLGLDSGSNPESVIAVHGQIPYPINIELLKSLSTIDSNELKTAESIIKSGNRFNLELNFEIGSLDLSTSREELQYTSKTYDAIVEKIRQFKEEVKIIFYRILNENESLRSNLLIGYEKEIPNCLKDIAVNIPIFNEQSLSPFNLYNLTLGTQSLETYYLESDSNNKVKLKNDYDYKVKWDSSFCFLIKDIERTRTKGYIKSLLLERDYAKVYFVDKDRLKDHAINNHVHKIKLSSLIKKVNKNKEPRKKKPTDVVTVYSLSAKNKRKYCKGVTKHCLETTRPRNLLDTLYYIKLDDDFDFKIIPEAFTLTANQYLLINKLLKLTRINKTKIFFVKPKDFKFIGKNWQDLGEVFRKRIEEFGYTNEQNNDFVRTYNLFSYHYSHNHLFIDLIEEGSYKTLVNSEFPFSKLLSLASFYLEEFTERESLRLKFLSFTKSLNPHSDYLYHSSQKWKEENEEYFESHPLTKLVEEIKQRYPILKVEIQNARLSRHEDFEMSWIINYVNAIEEVLEKQSQMHLT